MLVALLLGLTWRNLHDFPRRAQYGKTILEGASMKCELLFASNDQVAGWSEVYFVPGVAVNDAVARMVSLAVARANFLSPDCTITDTRITAPLAPPGQGFLRAQRRAYLRSLNIGGNFKLPGIEGFADVAWTGVMLRLMDATRSIFKNQIYRGVPDGFWGGNPNGALAYWAANIGAWRNALVAAGAYILHFDRPTNSKLPAVINEVQFMRMVHRNTGRPFATLRGRR
jgi:hypothetical protein